MAQRVRLSIATSGTEDSAALRRRARLAALAERREDAAAEGVTTLEAPRTRVVRNV
jgi:hypothetical protein